MLLVLFSCCNLHFLISYFQFFHPELSILLCFLNQNVVGIRCSSSHCLQCLEPDCFRIFSLIDKHFPKSNPLHKIVNRNTLKLSYSYMGNIKTIIPNQNKAEINKSTRKLPLSETSYVSKIIDTSLKMQLVMFLFFREIHGTVPQFKTKFTPCIIMQHRRKK